MKSGCCLASVYRPARFRRGAALLLVLGLIATLGWLVGEIVISTRRNLAAQAVHVRKERLRATAWSAAESVIALLREKRLVDGDLYTLPHDATNLLRESGYEAPPGLRVEVALADDSGKTGLATLGADGLRDLFTDLGLPFDTAARLADSYLDSASAGDTHRLNGASRDDYAAAGAPRPLGRLPVDFYELLSIPGFAAAFTGPDGAPNDLARDFHASVTFAGDTRDLNLNTAPLPALRRLAKRGVIPDAAALEKWLAGPDGVRGTDDDSYARDAAELGLAGHGPPSPEAVFTVRRVRLSVTIHLEDASFRLTLLADPTTEKPGLPWKLLRMTENRNID